MTATVIGVLGGSWRAEVTTGGWIEPWDGEPLGWWVAAEDRWHDPSTEPTVRQRRLEGTPVVETRVRVPGGDVVQRVFAVADAGGVTVVEFDNESPASVAVALSHGRLLTARPPAAVPIEGIRLPEGAVVFPLGHRASVRVCLAHDGRTGQLPERLPTALAVARGWTRQTDRASRLVLPDPVLVEHVVAVRCRLTLAGPVEPDADAAGFLLGVGELVRMGADPDAWVPDVVTVAERLARSGRVCGLGWDGDQGLAAAERVLVAARDRRAAGDVAGLRARLGGFGAPAPASVPDDVRVVPWTEGRLASPQRDGSCVLLPDGHLWLGANWEAHHLPAGPASRVSCAVRWHGERPAVLWETEGDPVVLRGPGPDAAWHTGEPCGEALWPPPPPDPAF